MLGGAARGAFHSYIQQQLSIQPVAQPRVPHGLPSIPCAQLPGPAPLFFRLPIPIALGSNLSDLNPVLTAPSLPPEWHRAALMLMKPCQ